MIIAKPLQHDTPEYCKYYIALIKETDLIDALLISRDKTVKLFSSISSEKETFYYDEGKWTIKQVLSHIIECERIYIYRALRFSRKDNTDLEGFEENIYAVNSNTSERGIKDLLDEYISVRESTIIFYNYLSYDMLDFKAKANNVFFTPRTIGWMAAGHNKHHNNIIKERYL